MPSSAISAQGSVLSIGTGSGGAKTITGIQIGFPTIFTISAHGFSNGDVLAFNSAFAGANASALNGLTGLVVTNKTTNTFAIDIDTTGLTITAGTATATPTTWTTVNNLVSYNGMEGAAPDIDKSNLSSTAKEFIVGLLEEGSFGGELQVDNNDPGQAAMRSKRGSGAVANFKLVLPGATSNLTYTFAGYVKKFPLAGGVDSLVKSSFEVRITGAVTLA